MSRNDSGLWNIKFAGGPPSRSTVFTKAHRLQPPTAKSYWNEINGKHLAFAVTSRSPIHQVSWHFVLDRTEWELASARFAHSSTERDRADQRGSKIKRRSPVDSGFCIKSISCLIHYLRETTNFQSSWSWPFSNSFLWHSCKSIVPPVAGHQNLKLHVCFDPASSRYKLHNKGVRTNTCADLFLDMNCPIST